MNGAEVAAAVARFAQILGLQPPTVDPPPRRLLNGAEAHSDERSSSGNADSLKTDMETMKLEWHAFMR